MMTRIGFWINLLSIYRNGAKSNGTLLPLPALYLLGTPKKSLGLGS